MNTAVSESQNRDLTRVLADLLVQAEASDVMLTDIGGNVLAQAPERDNRALMTIAALAAGAFAATRELAALSGETSFRSVSHEGEFSSLLVQGLEGEHLLVILFNRTTTLGLVKLYARRAAQELDALLASNAATGITLPDTAFSLDDTQTGIFDCVPPARDSGPRPADVRTATANQPFT